MHNINTEYPQSEITSKIIAACIKVHKTLGPGYMEVIYQRALSRELWRSNIEHSREQWLTIYYDGIKVGTKRVDFVIQSVLLEIKAKGQIENQDYIQTLSYLKASGYQIGLLVNFGSGVIQIKRVIN